MVFAARKLATAEDLLALDDSVAAEVLAGEIVHKAAPSGAHSMAQSALGFQLGGPFHRRGGGGAPGGWWLLSECDVELAAHDVVRPDWAGWRRSRVPEPPRERPVRAVPYWICEVLSSSNARTDLKLKLGLYHRHRVGHYWIVDPERETLTVHRWSDAGYLVSMVAARGEVVRAEPFEAIELRVGLLFGDDPDDPASGS